MNLKQLLKRAGVSVDIAKEVERKQSRSNEAQELQHQMDAAKMTREILHEALRGAKVPPFRKKQIIVDE